MTKIDEFNTCIPCETLLGGPEPEACIHFKDYLTPEEEEVLATLRTLKAQARELRSKIKGIEQVMDWDLLNTPDLALSPSERDRRQKQDELYVEFEACSRQLEELRATWKDWQRRREEEHHRKMVLLGHRPWDGGLRE
jgi:hypothetical protein